MIPFAAQGWTRAEADAVNAEADRRAAVAEREDAPPDDLGNLARSVERAEARKRIDWNARVIRPRPDRARTRVWVSIRGDARTTWWTAYLWHCPACGKGSGSEPRPYSRAEAILAAHIHSRHCLALFRLRVIDAVEKLQGIFHRRLAELLVTEGDGAAFRELRAAYEDLVSTRAKLGLLQDRR